MVRFGRTPLNARSPRNPDPNLSGWAGIEHEMTTHDDPMMSDYADDIDTMLVFAALFSAVVTTFAAQTYQSLQADSTTTTNQLIAYQISLQGTQPNVPPAIDSTITNLLSPQPSQTSTSARWINALFFLSLVLSLAAALMGIMAKQWIREYLKWNMPLAKPRENVLVRQIRIEAWESWRVEGIFWSIPILLELAMVLFLAGVSVLLWLLDDVVARTVTVVVAIFLGLFAAITVLPVFIKRCPYKSPTSWVLLRLYALIRDSCVSLIYNISCWLWEFLSQRNPVEHWADVISGWSYALKNDLATLNSWRDWDLDSYRVASWYGRSWPWYSDAATKYALAQLDEEACDLPLVSDAAPRPAAERPTWADTELGYVIRDVRETSVLLRALSWVEQASQEQRVRQYIEESMLSIHTPVRSGEFITDTVRVRTATDWCVLGALSNGELQNPHLLLTAPANTAQRFELRSIQQIRDATGVRVEHVSYGQQLRLGPSHMDEDLRVNMNSWWTDRYVALKSVVQLLAIDLQHITTVNGDRLLASGTPERQPTSGAHMWWRSESRLRRVAELVSAMANISIWRLADMSNSTGRDAYLVGLRAIASVPDSHLDIAAPGLRSLAYKVTYAIAVWSGNLDNETFPLANDASDDEVFARFGAHTQAAADPLHTQSNPESNTSHPESSPRTVPPQSIYEDSRAPHDILSLTDHSNTTVACCPVALPLPSRRPAPFNDPSPPPQHVAESDASPSSDEVQTPCTVFPPQFSHTPVHREEISLLSPLAPLSHTPVAEPELTTHQHEASNVQSTPIEQTLRDHVARDEGPDELGPTSPPGSSDSDDGLKLAEEGLYAGAAIDPLGIEPVPENNSLPPLSDTSLAPTQSIHELSHTAQDPSSTHPSGPIATADPESPSTPDNSLAILEEPSAFPMYPLTSDTSGPESELGSSDRPSDHEDTATHPIESFGEASGV